MKQFHLHLVSDSTGETVNSVSRAALALFDEVEAIEHVWSLVRTQGQLEKMIAGLQQQPGIVMYTLVDPKMRENLRLACQRVGVPCIPILGPVIREFSSYLEEEATEQPGSQYQMDEDYFERVEALNFALAHDDGQGHWNLEKADIVLVGVSRTSKSPTCIYLANRGYKAANVPFVSRETLPDSLFSLKNPTVVGLSISSDRLVDIRESRLQSMNDMDNQNYTDTEQVKSEIEDSRKLYRQQGWPMIDVTRRSVEETAAWVIQQRHKQLEKRALGSAS